MGALPIKSPKSAGLVRDGGRDVYIVSPPRIARLRGLYFKSKPRRLTGRVILSSVHLYRTVCSWCSLVRSPDESVKAVVSVTSGALRGSLVCEGCTVGPNLSGLLCVLSYVRWY